jgi:alpha-tubulin suppressor-like RCC1 family protein
MKKTFSLSSLVLVPILAVLAACGGGGSKDSSTTPITPTPPTVTLTEIIVTPANPSITVGGSQQMIATGKYSDSKIAVLSTGVTWTAAKGNNALLKVFTNGLVTGAAVGSDTITATASGVSGNTTVTVRLPWVDVAAGGNQSFGRKADGTLFGWGSNLLGQLGDTTASDRLAPTPVAGGVTTWRQIAVGVQHTVALRADGSLWAWGRNSNGQLGDGTKINRATPVRIGTATDWTYVAAGEAHTLAISGKTGLLWAWGRNSSGQLGDGTTVDRLVPTKIILPAPAAGGTAISAGWTTVAAGANHSLGLLSGSLYTWGNNLRGQLGNASTVDSPTPIPIGTSNWVAVTGGALHSAGIRSDGALFTWGDNSNGQIGNNGAQPVLAPWPASTTLNWLGVAAGANHMLALRADGTLWAWGANGDGQLGDGLGQDLGAPTQIGLSTNWVGIAAGLNHSFGRQTDNSLWGWGRNAEGQQGNGNTTYVAQPTQMP